MLAVRADRPTFFVNRMATQKRRYEHRKMEYEEFIDYLRMAYDDQAECLLKGYSGENFKERMLVKKANQQFLGVNCLILLVDVLLIKSSGKIYNLADLYDLYLKEDFIDVINTKTGECLGHLKKGLYGEVKHTFILKIFNYNLHRDALENFVYQREGDLVFILYQYFGYKDGTVYARKITKFELDSWADVDFDQVMSDALKNTVKLFPPVVYHRGKKKEVDFLQDDSLKRENMLFPNGNVLLSNSVAIDGALALFYPGVIPKMMKIFNGPFDAVFMNVNDVMIYQPDDDLAKYAAEYAKKSSEMGEMLSDKIYRCDESGVHPIR